MLANVHVFICPFFGRRKFLMPDAEELMTMLRERGSES
jgi:hypothetical protein